jgi:protein-S-isoprenylcysteine O-methyltransferase Ste14
VSKRSTIMGILLTLTAGGQILAAWLLYDPGAPSSVINTGWGILFLSAVFGWLPIFTFRARGKVEGNSYINTTVLVDSGIYSIVRHPQYLAGILINIALSLITTHWLVILLGCFSLVIYYFDTFTEEEQNLEKFGDEYLDYQSRVPRINFLLGIYRVLLKRFAKQVSG